MDLWDSIIDGKKLNVVELRNLRNYFGNIDDSGYYLEESRSDKDIKVIFKYLVSVTLEELDENEAKYSNEESLAKAKLALQIVVNAAHRSKKFGAGCSEVNLKTWMILLRVDAIRELVLASISALWKDVQSNYSLNADYGRLLSDLLNLWVSNNSSWILAFFSNLLEHNHQFLFECRHLLDTKTFVVLIHVIDTLVDQDAHGHKFEIHENNVRSCVDFVELLNYELEKEDTPEDKDKVEIICYLMEILSNLCRKCELESIFHDDQRLIRITSQFLLSVVCAVVDEAHRNSGFADRPAPENPKKAEMTQVQTKICHILREERKLLAIFKSNLIRVIGNLSHQCPQNQLEAGNNDAIYSVLFLCRLRENDEPFIVEWAILALRNLTKDCPPNQQKLMDIEKLSTGDIIDRERLFENLAL